MKAKQRQPAMISAVRQSHSRNIQVISGGIRKPPMELPVAASPSANPRRRMNQRLINAAPGMAPIKSTPKGMRLAQTAQTWSRVPAWLRTMRPRPSAISPISISCLTDQRSIRMPAMGDSKLVDTVRQVSIRLICARGAPKTSSKVAV